MVTVEAAMAGELASLERRLPGVSGSPLAAAALALAADIDDAGTSPTARSLCARAMRECLERLWELVPEVEQGSALDDLRARRAARDRGAAA